MSAPKLLFDFSVTGHGCRVVAKRASQGNRMVARGSRRDCNGLVAQARGLQVAFPGFIADRTQLARALASSDIYVSAMADETFGISIVEAQASGLPVVGVASGAMIERVTPGTGLLVRVDDVSAMAQAVVAVWQGNHAALSAAARAHVAGRFAWTQTFDTLLGQVYPQAFAAADARMKKGRPARRTAFPLGFE